MVLPKFLSKSSRKHRSTHSTSNSTSPSPSTAAFASPSLDTHNHPSIPSRRDSEPRSPASSPEKRARASADIPSASRSGSGSAKRGPVSPVKASSAARTAGSRRASPAPSFPDPFDSLDRDPRSPVDGPEPHALSHNGSGLHAAASHLSAKQRRRMSAQPAMDAAGAPPAQQQQDAASPRAFAAPSRPFVKPAEAPSPGEFSGSEPMSPVDMESPDVRPPVPPHRTPPGPSAEECKAAGNRFFKGGEFDKAVAEYSKGSTLTVLRLC
jgi:DnaJ family protein C protein 7